jgi:hypothetical protein
MIEIANKYRLTSDKYQWILSEKRIGHDKNGVEKIQWDKTYYPRLEQVCMAILDREAKDCDTAEEIIFKLNGAVNILVDKIEEVNCG